MAKFKVGDMVVVAREESGGYDYQQGDIYEIEAVYEGGYEDTIYDINGGEEAYERELDLYNGDDIAIEDAFFEDVAKGLGQAIDDVIQAPSHYVNSKIEPIDYMADKLPAYSDGFTAFCVGNVLKYVSRAPHKHATPLEDLRKARQYLDFAIKHEEDAE